MYLVDMVFTDLEKITPELTALHKTHLCMHYQSEKLMLGGPKVPRTGGLILSRHTRATELKEILDTDPFVINGVAEYTIIEFMPVMASQEFEPYANAG